MDRAPAVWGILNVTPDSFSDGGRFHDLDAALAHATRLVEEGADVLDVGGESTRPGAEEVPPEEEARRVLPVVEAIRRRHPGLPVSVDTRRAGLAARALDLGASYVNDVSAGRDDDAMLPLVAERGAGIVLMHMRGRPRTMQADPHYDDVVAEVRAWLASRVEAARASGIASDRILVDPGLGFGKTAEHNLQILQRLETLVQDGVPVMLGASRKSFLGRITGRGPGGRLGGSLACVARAFEAGVGAVRVHDVGPTRDLLDVLGRIRGATRTSRA